MVTGDPGAGEPHPFGTTACRDHDSRVTHIAEADVGRYEPRTTLGEGGMGEVLLCRDHRIGREVAMKVVLREHRRLPSRDATIIEERFLREARVQGQLEHPAIVPVYDLGKDALGRTFFTMKRVRGETLELVIQRIARGDKPTIAEYTRHKLLAAYARVCLAVDFAHSRGVIHRDLKPANVMLGDFGEVYVLDWGVAKVHSELESLQILPVSSPPSSSVVTTDESGERPTLAPDEVAAAMAQAAQQRESRERTSSTTEAGTVLGTPAYMAPEQRHGKRVDARTDIFALGAILFELLTLKTFHEHQEQRAFANDDIAPASRLSLLTPRGESAIPPELASIWRKATERDPDRRYASARELHDAIERYLSGDRDLAARKSLAEEHVATARALLRLADGETQGSPFAASHRSRALAELGSAIALAPEDSDALRLLVELLSEPPKKAPPEVLEELERASEQTRMSGLKHAAYLYTLPAILFFLPAMMMMGLKSVWAATLCIGSFLIAGGVAALSFYRHDMRRHAPWVTITSSIAMATSAMLSGVYVLLPTFVAANTICHAISGRRSQRTQIIALGTLALLVPTTLEMLGIIPPSHAFVDGSLVVTSRLFEMKEPVAPIFLVLVNVGLVVFSSVFVGQYRDALSRAQLRHLSQLWMLRQLVPERARSATSEPPEEPADGRCLLNSWSSDS